MVKGKYRFDNFVRWSKKSPYAKGVGMISSRLGPVHVSCALGDEDQVKRLVSAYYI